MLTIRRAVEDDIHAVTDVYNEAIRATTATFDTEPRTIERQLEWFHSHGPAHPILVAELDGQVVGWSCLTRWSDRPAYDETAETSFYVAEAFRGQGIGRKLKEAVIGEAIDLGYHTLLARVAAGSDASIHLNKSLGFALVGTMKEVGYKFGKRLDVHIFQKILPPRD